MASNTALLVAGNSLFREGITHILNAEGVSVIAEAADAWTAERAIDNGADPALILVDLDEAEEAPAIRLLRNRLPDAHIAVLSSDLSAARFAAALDAGASGYLLKDIQSKALARALTMLQAGQRVFPTHLAALLMCGRIARGASSVDRKVHGLSSREMQVLDRIVVGDSNKEIAAKIGTSEATVKVHIKSMFRKLRVNTRSEAAVWGSHHGFGVED